ncbi:MAG TPA: metallophosphoesterase [Actinomycetota bacterium]|nr:metallophosphoesterase [Actinomycetota bacterium]
MPLLRDRPGTRIFYAADLHGSSPTWRKFVNAAAFYGAEALVFGGDLMGKALVPIVRTGDRVRAEIDGERVETDVAVLPILAERIEIRGHYWKVMDPDEHARLAEDPLLIEGETQELARERLRAWIAFARERLDGTDVRVFLTGGNDDAPAVLEVLEGEHDDRIVPSEGVVVRLDDDHTMITVGLSTPTPWDTPREASEPEIERAIEDALAGVPDTSRCVFNLHCPPKDTILDRCLKLEVVPGQLPRPIREGGRFVTTGGGSVAVRQAIERHQPLVALHGHIHESPGRLKIGRTLCFNPGSEYGQGRLEGVLMRLDASRVAAYQHTSG